MLRRVIMMPLLLGAAFLAGMFYERGQAKERCAASGNLWVAADGYCGPEK